MFFCILIDCMNVSLSIVGLRKNWRSHYWQFDRCFLLFSCTKLLKFGRGLWFHSLRLATDSRTVTSDRTAYNNRLPFETRGWDNPSLKTEITEEAMNLLSILLGCTSMCLKAAKILQFWRKEIPDVRGTSFQRKWSMLLALNSLSPGNVATKPREN